MGVQANTKIRLPSGFNRLLASINSCRLMRPPENPKLYTLHPGRYVSKISGDSPLYVRESPSSRTSCTLFPHTLFRQKSSITASCLSRSVSGLTRQIATQHSNHPTDCMLRSFRQKFTTTPTIALVLSSSYPRASTTARSFLLSCSRKVHKNFHSHAIDRENPKIPASINCTPNASNITPNNLMQICTNDGFSHLEKKQTIKSER